MAFLSGLIILDAPASALNNAGNVEGATLENAVAVKSIKTGAGSYIPYVSAQSFRYWLRSVLERNEEIPWKAAPVFREAKIAYTDANPIKYWDDDLFGYMRAPGTRKDQKADREARIGKAGMTETTVHITRVSPFRVGTLIGMAPRTIVNDFGTMSRHEGDPVPHEHQFYHTALKGMISLDFAACGTFTAIERTGYRNLDDIRVDEAQKAGLEELEPGKVFRLKREERIQRVSSLLKALGLLYGGAKQTLHYTDVTPVIFLAVVTKGGNNPLQYAIGADREGYPVTNAEALEEIVSVWKDQFLSPIYAGWAKGFRDEEREKFLAALEERVIPQGVKTVTGHPREVLDRIIKDMAQEANKAWWA